MSGTAGMDACALTVVRAPLGYGKTTLLRELEAAARKQGQVLWIETTDASDRQLAQGMTEWVTDTTWPATIIIDNYHSVSTPHMDLSVIEMLERNPHVTVVVAGRRFCALDTPFLTHRVSCRVLQTKDLSPSTDQFRQVREQLERAVASSRTPADPQLILWALGLTEGTTLAVLNEVVEGGTVALETTMKYLENAGIVSVEWRGKSRFYVPHPAWDPQDSLRMSAAEEARTQARTLQVHAHQLARVDAVDGLALLLSNHMYPEADQYAAAYFLRLSVENVRTYPLLKGLPEDQLGSLILLQGLRLLLGQDQPDVTVATFLKWAEQAQHGVRALYPSGMEEADASHLTILLSSSRILGEWKNAEELALDLERKLAAHHYRNQWDGWSTLPLTYSIISLTGLLVGDLYLAERAARQALNISVAEDNPSEQIRSHNLVALLTAISGQVHLTGQHLRAVEEIIEKSGCAAPEMSESTGLLARAVLCLFGNDFEGGLGALEQLEPVLQHLETWNKFVEIESWLMRFHCGNRAALQRLQRRISTRETLVLSPQALASLTAMAANLSVYSGDLLAAEELLRHQVLETDELILAQARLAFMRGDLRQALLLASNVNRFPVGAAQNTAAILLGATALFAADDPAGALGELAGLKLSEEVARLPVILSTVPYSAMRDLAIAASDAGQSELLQAVNALPETHRFKEARPLTQAELRVLRTVAQGHTNKETAEYLGLSLNTVKAQLRAVHGKMGVSSRAELIRVASMRGIL